MLKIGATSCQILRLKCNKFDFGWGFAIDTLGSLQRSPRPPSWINGSYFKGEGLGGEGAEGRGRGGGG